MPTNRDEIKVAPLAAREIKAKLLLKGIDYAEIARRVKKRTKRACPISNVSRVVNRTEGFAFPVIREVIAEAIDEPVVRIGREATRQPRRKRATRTASL